MARRNFYDLLSNMKFSCTDEYSALMHLFKEEQCVWNGYTYMSVIEYINKYYFRSLPFRGSYLKASDMMYDLKLYDTAFVNLELLFLLCEFLIAILPNHEINNNKDLEKQAKVIFDNIFSVLERTNHKLFKIEQDKYIVVEKNKAATQAAEIVEEKSIAIELIEYNHYALKGDLDKKKRILNDIANYLEPVLKSREFNGTRYAGLASDVGFLINNFHIRHNNKVGAKAQDYIVSLTDKQLEDWYDKIYNALLLLIIAKENLVNEKELEELKNNYKWKT